MTQLDKSMTFIEQVRAIRTDDPRFTILESKIAKVIRGVSQPHTEMKAFARCLLTESELRLSIIDVENTYGPDFLIEWFDQLWSETVTKYRITAIG